MTDPVTVTAATGSSGGLTSGQVVGLAGAQSGGNLLGTLLTNRANKKMAQYQFQQNQKMWEMQNEYNHPKNQMGRLIEAGLNPNLVYGNSAVGNTTSDAPKFIRPDIDYRGAVPDMLSQYLAYRQNNASVDLATKQADNQNAQALATLATIPGVKANAELQSQMAKYAQTFAENQVFMQSEARKKAVQENVSLKLDSDLKQYEKQLNEMGLTKSDSLIDRQLYMIGTELGTGSTIFKEMISKYPGAARVLKMLKKKGG